MHIILIANYKPDKQESMERFTQMLYRGFIASGITTEIWYPAVFFGRAISDANTGVGKWLGYADKWILYPIVLRIKQLKRGKKKTDKFHICDHSNAPYLAHLPALQSSITCHDVLAIRGAFGYADAYCTASRFGKILQKWILKNLTKARKIATVSELTLKQLVQLNNGQHSKIQKWQVIPNAFNDHFEPLTDEMIIPILQKWSIPFDKPFILHVGSALPRKNRILLLNMVNALGPRWDGNICFAGQPMDTVLRTHANTLGLENRIVEVIKPAAQVLLALYSRCEAFVFPSYSEGFGWPVIEAQACATPVLASNIEPMPEVSGGAAIHLHPDDALGFANALLSLKNIETRNRYIQMGLENTKRFEPQIMINAYLNLLIFSEPIN